MKWIAASLLLIVAAGCAHQQPKQPISFDTDWRFALGDPKDASAEAFDDSKWRKLDVPHDWSIEGDFDREAKAGGAGGFLPTGIGWYRKHFTLPAAKDKRVLVEFDGVMANSDVFINGINVGHRPYGYIGFRYDLTDHIHFGGENVLAVRCDNEKQPASRWYAGCGIYRHVRLSVLDAVHFDDHATFITTSLFSGAMAIVHVQTTVMNQSTTPRTVKVSAHMASGSGESAKTTVPPNASADVGFDVRLLYPLAWDIDHPNLYASRVTVQESNNTLDEETIRFGMREFRFDADTGFWLNGKNIKLKGACVHADGGAWGAAVPLGAWERRLKTLQSLGVNAIRTAHNPPAPEFLDLCDRLGLLVMDENFDCWTVGKNRYDYHLYFNEWSKIDTRDMVRRDRNHPCIVLWSTGNEIHDTPKADIAKPILQGLVEVFHENDPTRPVTQALFRPNVSHDYDNGLADLLDVVGQNYRENEILAAHEQKPARKIIGTENGHDRRIWLAARDNKPYAGQFLWSGIDYLGESFRWPTICAGAGLLDRTGAVKPMGRERQSWWSDEPMVFIARRIAATTTTSADPGFAPLRRRQTQFADWSPIDRSAHVENVEAYSNCESVELFLNGKSLGAKRRNDDDSARTWTVSFEPGTLKAVARSGEKVVATHELQTAGKAVKLILCADRTRIAPQWDDFALITVTAADESGTVVPDATDEVTFAIDGPGAIAAVDNADNASHERFRGNVRKLFQGRCVVMVRANADRGEIHLGASAAGLERAQVTLTSAKGQADSRAGG